MVVPAPSPAVTAPTGSTSTSRRRCPGCGPTRPLLERAVANLVDNALRYAPPGTTVRVEAGADRRHVDLRVVDRGRGIPAADRERVFQPFQRLGDNPNGSGVGLGLAVARGFVEAMGGELAMEDTPGGGCTMVVSAGLRGRPAA